MTVTAVYDPLFAFPFVYNIYGDKSIFKFKAFEGASQDVPAKFILEIR